MKKKILIISGAFYPDNSPRSFRTTELVKEFCRQGHDVTLVVEYKPVLHDPLIETFGFKLINLGKRSLKALKNRSNKYLNLLVRGVNRLTNLLFEYPDIELFFQTRNVLRHASGYDLMISIAVPHPIHWGVAWSRTKEHPIAKTWVADCGDPYYLNQLDSFRHPFYFKYIESYFCRKADYVSIPMLTMKDNFLPVCHDKLVEIPQGFKIEDSLVYLKPYTKNPVSTFAFSGSFIPGSRDPRQFLEYVVNTDIDFRLHIFTMLKHYVTPFMEKAGKRIILHDYIPRIELLAFQSQMDFLLNFTFDPKHQVPSKLIDYLIAGKPILNIEPDLDKNLVDQFLAGNYAGKFTRLSLDRYKIEQVTAQFLSLAK